MFKRRANSKSSLNVKDNSRQGKAAPARPKIRGILKVLTKEQSFQKVYVPKFDNSRGVKFMNVEIREYARTLGDNPSCSSGPPVAISWDYLPAVVIPLEEYEKNRPMRRTHIEMILPRAVRQRILRMEWQIPQSQIASAVRNNIKVKSQRRTTVNNLNKSARIEEAMESAGRRLGLGKRSDKELRSLEKQAKAAEQARGRHGVEKADSYDDSSYDSGEP